MIMIVIRARKSSLFSEILIPRKSLTTFWEIPEAAARSWLSEVDIVAARTPARITPARSAGRIPCLLNRLVIAMMTVSGSSRAPIEPYLTIPSPTTPMNTATVIAITTQIVAIRRERTSFFSSSMDMKRTRI